MHTVQTHIVKGATVLRNIMDLPRISLASGSVHFETCFSSNIYTLLVPDIVGQDEYGLLA